MTVRSGVSGDSGSMSVSAIEPMRADGGSRSSRWMCATPRNRPVGVSFGGRQM